MLVALLGLELALLFAITVAAGFLAGYCSIEGHSLLYALSLEIYPQAIRATGVGASVAVGSLGSVAGPLVAGWVLSPGMGPTGLLLVATPELMLAACAANFLIRASRWKMLNHRDSSNPLHLSTDVNTREAADNRLLSRVQSILRITLAKSAWHLRSDVLICASSLEIRQEGPTTSTA